MIIDVMHSFWRKFYGSFKRTSCSRNRQWKSKLDSVDCRILRFVDSAPAQVAITVRWVWSAQRHTPVGRFVIGIITPSEEIARIIGLWRTERDFAMFLQLTEQRLREDLMRGAHEGAETKTRKESRPKSKVRCIPLSSLQWVLRERCKQPAGFGARSPPKTILWNAFTF